MDISEKTDMLSLLGADGCGELLNFADAEWLCELILDAPRV